MHANNDNDSNDNERSGNGLEDINTTTSNEQQPPPPLPASGSFFYEVPSPPKKEESSVDAAVDGNMIKATIGSESITSLSSSSSSSNEFGFGNGDLEMFQQIVRKTRLTAKGGGAGFAKTTSTSDYTAPSIIRTTRTDTSTGDRESFVGIGMPLNDVNNPEYDSNGYTLYADEVTGEKRRVFEALVEYPSIFKMKIVGSDDGGGVEGGGDDGDESQKMSFAPSIVKVVAESCGVDVSDVRHSIRKNGKWISVTVHAPVQNADMLYSLYENVDKDSRVKFKF